MSEPPGLGQSASESLALGITEQEQPTEQEHPTEHGLAKCLRAASLWFSGARKKCAQIWDRQEEQQWSYGYNNGHPSRVYKALAHGAKVVFIGRPRSGASR